MTGPCDPGMSPRRILAEFGDRCLEIDVSVHVTQLSPSSTYPIRRELRVLACRALL